MKTRAISVLTFLLLFVYTQAQDIHFSQFYNSPLNINPALTGIFPEDMRFIANYRRQWQSVPVPYLTFSGAYDQKYAHRALPNGFLGLGLIFNYDQQGVAELKLTQLALSVSYTHQLNEMNLLGIGVQLGTSARAFNTDGLNFENQYNGDIFDPSLSSRENFDNTSRAFMDFGAGLNWHLQLENGFRLDAGFGIFHLNRPEQNFYNQTTAELPFRTAVYGIGTAVLNERMDWRVRLIWQNQQPYREVLTGTSFVYYLNKDRGKELAFELGTNYRYADESDAVIPTLGVRYQMWRAEFSYDINLSQFRVATNGNGGPEFSIIYTITKVKPPKAFKTCPIF